MGEFSHLRINADFCILGNHIGMNLLVSILECFFALQSDKVFDPNPLNRSHSFQRPWAMELVIAPDSNRD